MTILFSNSNQKYANQAFLVPLLRIFVFCTKLCNKANLRALMSNMRMVFQNCCPKHPKKLFLVPNLRFQFLHEILQLDKLGSVDYKYDNCFSKFHPKDPFKAFLVPRLFFFWFGWNFIVSQIRGCWFNIW